MVADTELSYDGEKLEKALVMNAAATLWCCMDGSSGGLDHYHEPEEPTEDPFKRFFEYLYYMIS